MLNGGGPQNEPSTCRGVVEVIYGGLFRGPIGIVVKRCLNFELEHIFKLLEKKSRGTFFLYFSSTSSFLILLLLGFFCSAKACGRLDHKIRTYVICVYDYFSSIFPLPFCTLPPSASLPAPHLPLPAAPSPPPPPQPTTDTVLWSVLRGCTNEWFCGTGN